ncbi:hypothetical protein QJQ45_005279 [Haematococcus lacustris]|nr:hypothetical protein QJQ45_005279 [Haematococcus lacustris]
MVKKKWKGTDKHKKGPLKKPNASRSAQGKQRQVRRGGWNTTRRQVIKVPEGAVLRGCKKTKRKLLEHLQLRAEVHSQLRVIASLFVLHIFLTCLQGHPSPGYRSAPEPPAVQPPQAPDAPPLPPLPPRAPAQTASMESDSDYDSESDCDSEPESQSDSESESEPEPVTQGAAAPVWQPLHQQHPVGHLCPLMLRQLKYPGLGYKRLRDKPPKAQEQQQQPAVAQ